MSGTHGIGIGRLLMLAQYWSRINVLTELKQLYDLLFIPYLHYRYTLLLHHLSSRPLDVLEKIDELPPFGEAGEEAVVEPESDEGDEGEAAEAAESAGGELAESTRRRLTPVPF